MGRPSSRRSQEPDDSSVHADLVAGTGGFQDGTTMEPAVQYVQKIKQRCDEQTYRQFLDILSSYHHKPDSVDEVCTSLNPPTKRF
jgi:histone deacetylase complex regulatory component SIN3